MTRQYIAGHYNCTWNGVTVGSTREGFHLVRNHLTQEVHDDAHGDAKADTINQGTNVHLEGIFVEAALLEANQAFWNHTGSTDGTDISDNKNVGLRGSDQYKQLVLTPIAGTPAAAMPTPTYTFPLTQIINEISILLASKLREIPCTFDVLPDVNNNNRLYIKS